MKRLLLLALLLTGCPRPAPPPAAPAPSPAPPARVTAAPVVERTVAQSVTLSGTITAENPVNLSAPVGGRVVEVLADVGDPVRRGQPLLRLDDAEARLQIRQDEADLRQALARLGLTAPGQKLDPTTVPSVRKAAIAVESRKQNWERYQALRKEELVSDSEVADAKDQYLSAQADYQSALQEVNGELAQIAGAEARLALDRETLDRYVVASPLDGVVQQRNVSPGDTISGAQAALVLVDLDRLFLTVQVPETLADRVGVGTVLQAATSTVPPRRIRARVVQVGPTVDPQTRTLQARARLEPAPGLLPGMFASTELEVQGRTKRMLVPQAAVLTQGGASRVYTLVQAGGGWEVRAREVGTGATSGDLVEVTGDLHPGQRVAASNLAALKDGAPVELAP